jgi:stage II sporulation protein D
MWGFGVMSFIRKKSISVSTFLLVLLVLNVYIVAVVAFELPQNIRIGLFFSDSAVDSVDISSETGIIIGYNMEGQIGFELAYDFDIKSIKLSKCEYHYNTKGFDTAGYGINYIDLGIDFSNFDTANERVQELVLNGFSAVPVYSENVFKVWIGAYETLETARNGIGLISRIAPDAVCKVVQPSSKAIIVSYGEDIFMLFDNEDRYITVMPILQKDITPIIGINEKRYRGHVEVRRTEKSDMTVINIVDFNEYLYSVVPGEMPAFWHSEALKAQAVAVRSYSVNNLKKYSSFGFNMCNTTASQVYKGYDAENPNTTNAVFETKDEILRYEGQPAKVYYFSNSGGHTEDIRNVWGGPEVAYLKGVDDPYEKTEEASNGIWRNEVSAEQLTEHFNNKGYNIGRVVSVIPEKHSESGRVIKLKIVGTEGEVSFENYSTCTVLGSSIVKNQKYMVKNLGGLYIKSKEPDFLSESLISVKGANGLSDINLYQDKLNVKGASGIQEVTSISDTFIFEGRGWGHGVGLSQWGTKGMAEAGYTYKQILEHYFPGTEVY